MFAGFWRRAAAFFIDGIIIWVISMVVMAIVMLAVLSNKNFSGVDITLVIVLYVIATIAPIFYWIIFEASPLQATLGKMALGIKVTDKEGNRVTFLRSMGRNFGKIISYLTFYIGFAMAGFTVKKQALHDKMADALVVTKEADVKNLAPLAPAPVWLIILAVLGALLPFVFMIIGIIAAMLLPSAMAGMESARVKQIMPVMSQVLTAQENYKQSYGNYARSFAQLNITLPGENEPEDEVTADVNDFDLVLADDALLVIRDMGAQSYTVTSCYQGFRTKNNMCCSGSEVMCRAMNMQQVASPVDCCR